MKVLLFDDNLFWSARLQKTLYAMGHECEVLAAAPDVDRGAEIALVNLSQKSPAPEDLLPALKGLGLYVVGYAGHKETELREMGAKAGCDRIASNGEMTFKLGKILEQAAKRRNSA